MSKTRDFKKAKRHHKTRSKKAQDVDNALLSKLTKSYEVWKTDPSRFDMMGVDTPNRRRR